MLNIALFITMVTIFVGYVATIIGLYGILPSISESYYRLPKKWNFIFTLSLWGFAFPAIIIGTPITGLMFAACSGIIFVGGAAAFQQKITNIVHILGASIGMVLSQVAIATSFGMWPITAVCVPLAGLIFLFRKQINYTHLFWIEIVCFAAIGLAYGLYIF